MAEQPKRICVICGKEVWDLRRRDYCSSNCADAAAAKEAAEEPPKPPKRKPAPNPRPVDADAVTAAANTEPPDGEPDTPRKRIKFRGKRSDELLAAIFEDMAQYNMTQEQSCYGHSVRPETFSRWLSQPGCEGLRARAQFHQIKRLIHKQETEPEDWKRWQWRLQVTYRQQFGDPAKIGVQLNQQFNNGDGGNLAISGEALDEARKVLNEVDILQAQRKTGASTTAELRQIMIEKISECQSIVDYIDGGGTHVFHIVSWSLTPCRRSRWLSWIETTILISSSKCRSGKAVLRSLTRRWLPILILTAGSQRSACPLKPEAEATSRITPLGFGATSSFSSRLQATRAQRAMGIM